MEVIFLVILVALLGVVSAILYLNLKSKPQVEKAVQTENVEKFVERNKQLKN